MVVERTYGSFAGGSTSKQIGEPISAVGGSSAWEIGGGLERYDIKVDTADALDHLLQATAERRGGCIVDATPLLLRLVWQETVERPITPEIVAEIPISELEPEPVDDLDWLIANMQELVQQYAGQWVAIAQGQVVASASTVPELKEVIETTGIERPLVTFISEQEPNWNMAYG